MPNLPALPLLLAILAAMLFGTSSVVARIGLRHADARQGTLISIGSTTAFLWLLYPLLGGGTHWTTGALLRFAALFAGVGAISPSLSLLLAFEGNRRLGPTVSGTVASTAPLFAVTAAVLLLGEHLTPMLALGTLGVVAGVMVLSWRGRRPREVPGWALLLPLGAAALRGVSHMATKYGLNLTPAPYVGVLIAFNASFLLVGSAHRLQGRTLPPGGLRAFVVGGSRWFVVTGFLNGMALLCQFTALGQGRVVVVSPVVSTFPLFTFAVAMLLGVERLGVRIGVGVLVVVAGVALVASQ